METKEELMGRILTAATEQNGLMREDGDTPLSIEAAQDYIIELESKVKILARSKAGIIERLDEYQGDQGPYLLFKDMLLKALDDDNVMEVIKDEVLDGHPDIEDIDYRVTNLEDDKMEDYDIIDTVIDSTSFENNVNDMIESRLREVKFKVTME